MLVMDIELEKRGAIAAFSSGQSCPSEGDKNGGEGDRDGWGNGLGEGSGEGCGSYTSAPGDGDACGTGLGEGKGSADGDACTGCSGDRGGEGNAESGGGHTPP